MNVDQEFFRIVEDLGPLGSFELHQSTSRRVPEAGGCGCKTDDNDGSACCSTPARTAAENAWSKVTFAAAPEGPADQSITPFPKWDAATGAWWVWDDSKATWLKAA